jgi:hypothetical protein
MMTPPHIALALESLTVNPLGASFVCEGCGTVCDAVTDSYGTNRNRHENDAVLYAALPEAFAIRRHDFCTPQCLQEWRTLRSEPS